MAERALHHVVTDANRWQQCYPPLSIPSIFVLSGPSGVGKDAVLEQLKAYTGLNIHRAVTATTRQRRPGEVDGVDYFFLTPQTFASLEERGSFLETVEIYGYRYGTPIDHVRAALERGQDVVLKIDVAGARQVRQRVPDAVLVFLAPPHMDALIARLYRRKTESPQEIDRRVRHAYNEMCELPTYDYLIINQPAKAEVAAEQFRCIIEAQRHKLGRRPVVL